MGKLLSKNKKILFLLGFVLFLSLTIPRFALAVDCSQYNENNCPSPDCVVVWVYDALGQPIRGTGNCQTAVQETSTFCPGAHWWNLGMWLQCILEFLGSLPLKIPIFFIAALGIILAILGGVLLLVLQGIAGQMIYYSINLSTTPPTAISDIAGDVRTVAVQLLFLFLAIIGLATILKIQEYQMKKALVPLIVVALLINFSGAIVEAVVNIGNSFTLAFFGFGKITIADLQSGNLKIIEPTQIFETFKMGIENLRDIILKDGHFFDTINDSIISLTTWAAIGYIAALFFIVAALAIFIFGLVFFIRVVFIWLLIIIAPIAFVSAVFKTKEIEKILPGPLNWNGWWTSLLEWSFMGVGLALWLALAMKLKGIGNLTYIASTTGTSTAEVILQNSEIQKLFGNIFAYLAPLVALWLGVTTAPGMIGDMSKKAFGAAKGLVTAGAIAGGVGVVAGAKGFSKAFKGGYTEAFERSQGKGHTRFVSVLEGMGRGVGKGIFTGTKKASQAGGKAWTRRAMVIAKVPPEIRPKYAKGKGKEEGAPGAEEEEETPTPATPGVPPAGGGVPVVGGGVIPIPGKAPIKLPPTPPLKPAKKGTPGERAARIIKGVTIGAIGGAILGPSGVVPGMMVGAQAGWIGIEGLNRHMRDFGKEITKGGIGLENEMSKTGNKIRNSRLGTKTRNSAIGKAIANIYERIIKLEAPGGPLGP